MSYALVAVGASWGGLAALGTLLEDLDPAVEQPIVVAQHRSAEPSSGRTFEALLQLHTTRRVVQAADKDVIESRHVYVAPPDYHLLVERGTLALSIDARVEHARPSIDVLFESVADAYADRAVGIVLTGANADGAAGLRRIKEAGGAAIVQLPEDATRREMPEAALAATQPDAVLPLRGIAPYLRALCAPVAEGAGLRPAERGRA